MPELEIYSDFNCAWCYFDKPFIRMNGTKLVGSQTYENLEELMAKNNIPKRLVA